MSNPQQRKFKVSEEMLSQNYGNSEYSSSQQYKKQLTSDSSFLPFPRSVSIRNKDDLSLNSKMVSKGASNLDRKGTSDNEDFSNNASRGRSDLISEDGFKVLSDRNQRNFEYGIFSAKGSYILKVFYIFYFINEAIEILSSNLYFQFRLGSVPIALIINLN